MRFVQFLSLVSLITTSWVYAAPTKYNCTLKIHCSKLHEDQSAQFEYLADPEAKCEPKTIDLGVVRGRVFAPHYISLYLFDTRHPQTIWTKTHSNSFVNDIEVSLVVPEDETHSMVANLRCEKNN